MKLHIDVSLHYLLRAPTDILLQIEVAEDKDQRVLSVQTNLGDTEHLERVEAENSLGDRLWLRLDNQLNATYAADIELTRSISDVSSLPATPPHLLPAETVRYLMPSRYCPSDEFNNYVAAEFSDLFGGQRIAAMRDWIESRYEYVPGSSTAQTTALDTFVQRRGICRDFAHVLITLARASAIPARFASVYAPGVTPQDFHAVVEVFLDGAWHLVDPTGMAAPHTIAKIGVGADAAQVAFLSAFGSIELVHQSVNCTALDPEH